MTGIREGAEGRGKNAEPVELRGAGDWGLAGPDSAGRYGGFVMMPSRAFTWLPLTGLILLVALGFGSLMLGLAGDRTGMQRLTRDVAILPEAPGRAESEPAEIAALPNDAWQPWTEPGFVSKRVGRAAWVRVTLRNDTAVAQAGVLSDAERYADQVDFYVKEENGAGAGWRHLRSGERVPARAKALWGREAAFPVLVPARGTQTVYLRYEDNLTLWLGFNWWPEAGAFHAAVLRDVVAESAYFGTLLALLLYNLVLWVRVRFPGTGAYLLYLGSFLTFAFFARSQPALLGWSIGSPWMEVVVTSGVALSGLFLAEFARQLLELPERLPRADRVARTVRQVMGGLALAAPLLAALGQARLLYLIVLAGMAAQVALVGVVIAAWRAKVRSARYFVLAFGFLFAGLVPVLATWVPAVSIEAVGRLTLVGSALEMLLLSVAIADRFARMQQDKLAAQAQAIIEGERLRQIQEAYADELKHEVHERTRELAAANADKDRMMAVLGHDLRSPLTALTLSAEQVATDRVAAEARPEFAAEAARTGHALLLLLEDVVLWARLRAGPGRAVDQLAEGVVAPAAELHRAAAVQRGVTLEVAAAAGLRVRTDLVLTQTLVRNLTSNALKSARTRVVVTATETPDGRVRISVRDDGPGLPLGVSSHLETVSAGRAGSAAPWHTSSGLGLKLCLEIAQALGTRLESTVPDGGGAEISFTLPRGEI